MAKKSADYRTLLAELTQLLNDMQDGELDVDQAVRKHHQGQELIRQLNAYLDQTENTITIKRLPNATAS